MYYTCVLYAITAISQILLTFAVFQAWIKQ